MDYQKLMTEREMAPLVGQSISAIATDPVLVVQHVPTLGTGAAAATVSVSSLGLYFKVTAATPAGNDVIGDTTGRLLAATYTNFGLLVDAINAKQAWRAYLTGPVLRSTATAKALKPGNATSCIGAVGATVYGKQNQGTAYKATGLSITGDRFVSNGIGGFKKDSDDMVQNELYSAVVEVTGAAGATLALQVYSTKIGVETLIYSKAITTSTVDTTFTPLQIPYLSSVPGERLVVRVLASTTIASVIQFTIAGKSLVLSGSRMVNTQGWAGV